MKQPCNGCDTVDYDGDLSDAGVCVECIQGDDDFERECDDRFDGDDR